MATDTETLYELQDIKSTLGSLDSRIGSLPPSVQPVSHVGTFPVSGDFYPPIQQISGTVQSTGVVIGTINVVNVSTQKVTGTVQAHAIGGSVGVQEIGTFIVRRSGSFWPSVQEVSGTVQAHILSGSLSVKNFPATQTVAGTVAVKEVGTFIVRRSGSFWPQTQEISGTVQSHILSGSVGVNNFPAVQEISGTIQTHVLSGSIDVKNFPLVQPVSGTVAVKEVGTFIVRRSGSFWQAIQEVHMGNGSVGIHEGSIRITGGSIRVQEIGTFIVRRSGSFWPQTQEISGTVQSHVLSGSLNVREVGTFIVRRSGSFWPSLQNISGTIQAHVLSGSIDIRSSALPTGASTEVTLAKLPAQGTFYHGRKSSIGTTPVQIGTLTVPIKLGVLVKAAYSNYAKIYLGNSNATADAADTTSGFELIAGESILVKINRVDKVYVISSGTNQKAFWEAI